MAYVRLLVYYRPIFPPLSYPDYSNTNYTQYWKQRAVIVPEGWTSCRTSTHILRTRVRPNNAVRINSTFSVKNFTNLHILEYNFTDPKYLISKEHGMDCSENI